eukprot:3178641-Amphidinium_carterae.1
MRHAESSCITASTVQLGKRRVQSVTQPWRSQDTTSPGKQDPQTVRNTVERMNKSEHNCIPGFAFPGFVLS